LPLSNCAVGPETRVCTPNCFDRPNTISLDNPWLFFNVEQLSDDPRLETAMSLLIAHATARRASGKDARRSITVLDECWFLLDSPVLAPEVVQLFRTARKRNANVWGIGQTTENFVGTESKPRVHGAGIVKNTTTKIIGQQPGDTRTSHLKRLTKLFLHVQGTVLARLPAFSRSAALPRRSPADALISPASSSPASTTTESCRRILRNAARAARSAAGSSRCGPAAPRSQLLRSHPPASSGWCHSANFRCPGPPDRVSHTLSGAAAVKPMVL